jgi:hypothetical protein
MVILVIEPEGGSFQTFFNKLRPERGTKSSKFKVSSRDKGREVGLSRTATFKPWSNEFIPPQGDAAPQSLEQSELEAEDLWT